MGAGKTTVGRILAKRLALPFFDSDHEIVEKTGVPIPTIFEIEGEQGFRKREAQTILEFSRRRGVVLATGGGAVLDEQNRKRMRETGWVAYLKVEPQLLFERTRHDRNRPLLQVDDPLTRLETLYKVRHPLYQQAANFVVEGGVIPPSVVVSILLKEINLLNKK